MDYHGPAAGAAEASSKTPSRTARTASQQEVVYNPNSEAANLDLKGAMVNDKGYFASRELVINESLP